MCTKWTKTIETRSQERFHIFRELCKAELGDCESLEEFKKKHPGARPFYLRIAYENLNFCIHFASNLREVRELWGHFPFKKVQDHFEYLEGLSDHIAKSNCLKHPSDPQFRTFIELCRYKLKSEIHDYMDRETLMKIVDECGRRTETSWRNHSGWGTFEEVMAIVKEYNETHFTELIHSLDITALVLCRNLSSRASQFFLKYFHPRHGQQQ